MKLKIHGDLSYFWQWDLNRKLVVDDGGVCSQVHFCNGSGEALVCTVRTENGIRVADVPNVLLQKAEPVKAYLYTDAEDGTRTRSLHRFEVLARSKPEAYIYTETEALNYAYLDERLKDLEGEGLANAVADYLKENPVEAGATAEEAAQIQQNKEGIEQLSQDKLDASKLPEAVDDALAQAKASGAFKGEKGDPGEPGKTPEKGKDYFTEADKQEIAELAAEMVEVPDSGQNINPVAKTDDMTQPVGVDADGRLWVAPTSDNSADSGESDNGGDTLLGTLPYTITETGCYLLSEVHADISTGVSGENNLYGLRDDDAVKTLNDATIDEQGNDYFVFTSAGSHGKAYLQIQLPETLEAGKTYTLVAKGNDVVTTGEGMSVRVIGATVTTSFAGTKTYGQLNLQADTDAFFTFTVESATQFTNLNIYGGGTNAKVYDLAIFEGTHTERPKATSFSIEANTKYNADAYIGTTLTAVNGETVEVYKTNTGNSETETETDNGGVIFFGDSILDFSDVTTRYAAKTGKSVLDCAVGGTRMSGSRDSANEYYPYDMTNIADAIASGDFSAQTGGGKNSNFTTLASGNISAYKAIVLEFGTNDFTGDVPFSGTDVTSVEGAMKHILTTILTAYPNMRIVVLSTLQFVGVGDGSTTHAHENGTVWQMNATIKEICESDDYCVPFVDMYHAMGENALTRATLTSDGVHLMSPNGSKRYADILTAKLNGLGI